MVLDFFIYVGEVLLLTLCVPIVCGLAAWLAERLFVRLSGSGKILYVSSVIGTPIHELGHALMCLLFGHKITELKLLLPPNHPSGTLGYVSHSYNRKNPWAVLGNLFIGIGPIFSGLGVMILALVFCFPVQWNAYITNAWGLVASGTVGISEILDGVISLLLSMPEAFAACWWQALIGLVIILCVSQHVTLSGADIKGSLTAFPLYVLLLLIFGGITALCGVQTAILEGLWFFNLCLLSLFCLVIAFSAVWILLALLIWCVRRILRWF